MAKGGDLFSLAMRLILFFENIFGDCPKGTFNYINESCYIFIGQDVTAELWTNKWGYGPKEHLPQWVHRRGVKPIKLTPNGYSLGDTTQLSLAPCVWTRDQAEWVCAEFHEVKPSLYGHLANYSTMWHLPVLKTYAKDEWLHDLFVSNREKMGLGTSFWIDLYKRSGRHYWPEAEEEAFWIRRPAGIDRWWERCNVLMKNTTPDETMCYEFHTNYFSTRKPYLPMDVRGWHPRNCHGAYEEASDLDSDEDFTTDQLTEAETYWDVPRLSRKKEGVRCYYGNENHCVIPEVMMGKGGRKTSEACQIPPVRVRGKYRMRLAPIGVVCEADYSKMNVTEQ